MHSKLLIISECTFWLRSLLVWKSNWSSWGHISTYIFSFIHLKEKCQIFKKKKTGIKYHRSEIMCHLGTTNIQRKSGSIAIAFLENSYWYLLWIVYIYLHSIYTNIIYIQIYSKYITTKAHSTPINISSWNMRFVVLNVYKIYLYISLCSWNQREKKVDFTEIFGYCG